MMHTQMAILGVDAAWTEKNPSGVTLINFVNGKWECVALAPSYSQFIAFSEGRKIDWNEPLSGSIPSPNGLIGSCQSLLQGRDVTVVAVDMPISLAPITKRRVADTAISKEFGANKCSTHSPSATRPGAISQTFCEGFLRLGYELRTESQQRFVGKSLIEVYPHPALLNLLGESERLKYKAGKTSQYWKGLSRDERRKRLLSVWTKILEALKSRIHSIPLNIPKETEHFSLSYLKRLEDALDSLICAWVGITFIENNAKAFGDAESAIWVPCRP
jgi:predicted RNase H-like nuclease